MRKIKYLVLDLAVLLLCGCNVEYNLDITDGTTYSESFNIFESSVNLVNKDRFDMAKNNNVEAFYSEQPIGDFIPATNNPHYYKITNYESNGNYGLNYSYDYDYTNFSDASSLNECVENYNISGADNMIKLQFSGFKCLKNYNDLDSIRINIKVDHSVMYSNSDRVIDDTYVWIVNKGSYSSKTVTLYYKLDDNKDIIGQDFTPVIPSVEPEEQQTNPDEQSYAEEEKKLESFRAFAEEHKVVLIVGALLLFGIIIIIVVKIKKHKL